MPSCLLVDGYSLAFRAYYALPTSLVSSTGQVTNALHGFSNMLASLVERNRPDYMAVAFDFPGRTFRDDMAADYKGHRPETPEPLREQLPLLREMVRVLGIPQVELEGYEADDLLATLADLASNAGVETFIVTGDRDSFQLVRDPLVKILYNRRGVSEIDQMDEAAILAKSGVEASVYAEYAALRGDPSDNIAGVSGIGEKTAAKLISEYGSVAGVLANLDSLSPRLRESLQDARERLQVNLNLTYLCHDAPIGLSLEDLELGSWDSESARAFYSGLDLRRSFEMVRNSFAPRINSSPPAPLLRDIGQAKSVEVSLTEVFADTEFPVISQGTDSMLYLKVLWSGESGRSSLEEISLSSQSTGVLLRSDAIQAHLGDLSQALHSSKVTLMGSKDFFAWLSSLHIPCPSLGIDPALAAYLLDPGTKALTIEDISERYLGSVTTAGDASQIGLFSKEDTRSIEDYASDSALLIELAKTLDEELVAKELKQLYEEVEAPLVEVLAKMELDGILVDLERLRAINADLVVEVARLYQAIQAAAGVEFNPNSPQQLAQILFERLKLNRGKKNKTGYSTDAQTLEKLRNDHPVVEYVLRFRELDKLRSTFAEGLLAAVGEDGRIHARFNQMVARTGRISSESPNLHNIPIRTVEGRRFREVFVAPAHKVLIAADYSQIELRVLAHLSNDKNLIAALSGGHDVHSDTASRVFSVPIEQVTSTQRSKAKMVAYGLAYGMESYGLSQRLQISNSEADEVLNSFFAAFPDVRSYMDSAVAFARRTGYSKTLYGRRRYFSDLDSPNRNVRNAAERQAMNAAIQGLAADIFKIALVRLDRVLATTKAKVILQIHDEVLVEVEEDESVEIAELTRTTLSEAAELSVPLLVNVAIGRNWADAK